MTVPVKARKHETGGAGTWSGAAVLVALSGYLLLAHGCHGDEDHELFAPRVVGVGQSAGEPELVDEGESR